MTTISILCTMCGAAALSRGILKVIEYIGRQLTVDNCPSVLYNILCKNLQYLPIYGTILRNKRY